MQELKCTVLIVFTQNISQVWMGRTVTFMFTETIQSTVVVYNDGGNDRKTEYIIFCCSFFVIVDEIVYRV